MTACEQNIQYRTEGKPVPYLDTDTGAVLNLAKIKDVSDRPAQFLKVTKTEYYQAMRALSCTEILTFMHMYDSMTKENIFYGTYAELQEEMGVSNKTMITAMVTLQKHDLFRMVHPGRWMVNPKYVTRCSESEALVLFEKYAVLKPFKGKKKKKEQDNVDQ